MTRPASDARQGKPRRAFSLRVRPRWRQGFIICGSARYPSGGTPAGALDGPERNVTTAPMIPRELGPLTGPRLELRPLCESDADALVAAASDGDLWNLRFTV